MEMRTRNRPKHYYAGSERVATRIGGGGLYASGVDPKLSDRSGKVFCQSPDQVNSRRLKENKSDCIANGLCTHGDLLCDIMDIPSRLQADTAIDYTDFRRMIHDMRAIHHDEPDVYFYHSDHPGSASWITDNGGVAVQHLQYLPYGERYVDQRVTGYQECFTFTGKERDEETGYGYFGARYMDHELTTMWLSVDPMSDKYPGISPYAYCAWNPVKLVDPDGRDVWEVTEDGKVNRVCDEGGKKKQTVKYANGNTATFKGEKYHQVMSDLSTQEKNGVSSSYGDENMQSVYANVFKSMADNTSVEWRLDRYTDNHYALGTKHDESSSPTSSGLSKGNQNDKTVVTLIHSHPMVNRPVTKEEQISSMGYWYDKEAFIGDAANKQNDLKNANYYTYFPKTLQLWSIGTHRPAFIRDIQSFSDFFFGTFNTSKI